VATKEAMKYKNEIVQGDCLEVMAGMDADSIDLTVTSPPYDNLREYHGFTFNFEGIAKELYRITKSGGVVVWVVGDQTKNGSETGTSFRQALYFKEIGFNLHDTMIYYKWSGPLNHKRYEQEFEYMFVLAKGNIKTFNPIMVNCKYYGKDSDRTGQTYSQHNEKYRKIRSGIDRTNINPRRIRGNVWKMDNSSQRGERYDHPAIFPEKLANDHIISWSNEEDTVLDPMCGSGTTCKMAKMNNRNYIGIEVSAEYAEIARRRVEATHYQPDLFGICGHRLFPSFPGCTLSVGHSGFHRHQPRPVRGDGGEGAE